MQQPDGFFKQLSGEERDRVLGIFGSEKKALEAESRQLERETGKPHPVFAQNEEIEIKGGKFRILSIKKNRMILKPIPY